MIRDVKRRAILALAALCATMRAGVIREVFVVLRGMISTFEYGLQCSFRDWLRTITLNKFGDTLRKRQRQSEAVILERIEVAAKDEAD